MIGIGLIATPSASGRMSPMTDAVLSPLPTLVRGDRGAVRLVDPVFAEQAEVDQPGARMGRTRLKPSSMPAGVEPGHERLRRTRMPSRRRR